MPEHGWQDKHVCRRRRLINQGDRAMLWDDDKPQPPRAITLGEDLSRISVAELDERVAALEAEITRVRAEMTRKKKHAAAADALFKG